MSGETGARSQIIVTPVEGGFSVDLHGELGAILVLVDGKQKLPDAERAGSSLSVVAGARNCLNLLLLIKGVEIGPAAS